MKLLTKTTKIKDFCRFRNPKRISKKAQMNIFIYVLITLIIIFILSFGVIQINKFISSAREGEIITFVKTLESNLMVMRASAANREGSVKEEVFFLPAGIESICFFDETKGFNRLVSPELNEIMKVYEGYNIYFMPSSKFMPQKTEYLELSKDNNPLCIKVINGKIKLKLTSRKGKTQIDAAELNNMEINCVLADGVSDPNNKADIVFLGYGYDDKGRFRSDVKDYINIFFDIEPLSSNRDKFTFYLVDVFQDLDCSFRNWIECDNFKVKQLASNCPHDYIVVIVARSKIADFINPVRSSAFANVQRINTADNGNVMIHEFGHIFGGLADEYVDNYYYSKINFRAEDYPNCDSAGCRDWEDIIDSKVGCFGGGQRGKGDGCSLTKYYRPTESSIMRNLKHNYFGPVNEKVMTDKLDVYGGVR